MATPLSILIVEDSAGDAGLMTRQLQKDGFDVRHRRVDAAEQMRDALRTQAWDVVLSDFNIPGFGAAGALALLHESGLDLPFILVSGTIGEDAAVELMKAGAHDYVMKNNLARLGAVVRREIAESGERLGRRRAESALRKSEDRYRDLVENSRDLICTHDLEGKLLSVNNAAVRLSGYSQEALLRMNMADLLAHGARDGFPAYLAEIRATGAARGLMKIRTADGKMRWWEYHNSLRTEGVAEPVVRGMARDITERKKAQDSLRESEVQLEGIIESTADGILAVDGKGKVIRANRRFAELWRIPEPPSGTGDRQALPDAALSQLNDAEAFENRMRALHASAAGDTDTLTFKDGRVFEHHSSPLILDGTILGRVWSFRDITEKKRAENEIKRYVAQLETAFMSTVEVATSLSEMRDPYTAGHERRVAKIAVAIGAELGFDARRQEGLRVAGHLHDVGKITIPAEILSKPGKLSPIEYRLIQAHAQASYDVLKSVQFPWPVAEVALQHHERMDGSGYPRGLQGDAILFEARIMAVADVVEAMSAHRPYRAGLGIEAALAEIERGRGTAYDAAVADGCLKLFREKGYAIPD